METRASNESFGSYLRKLRLEANIGLREFAGLVNMKPSNYSNIERSKVRPPAAADKTTEFCDVAGIAKDSEEARHLLDLAGKERNEVASDVNETLMKFEGVPVLVRQIKDKKITEQQLIELTKYIQENY